MIRWFEQWLWSRFKVLNYRFTNFNFIVSELYEFILKLRAQSWENKLSYVIVEDSCRIVAFWEKNGQTQTPPPLESYSSVANKNTAQTP